MGEIGESALTGQVWAPLRGAQICYAKASSPIVRRLSGGGPERALKGLCGGELASLWATRSFVRGPCYDLPR
eukprot:15119308-Alexandrium_andersonii.AAC.1